MKDLINCENKPMYLNISENIIQNIYEENYKTQKLPSIRKSAEIFDVSIITIKSAYQLLEKFEIIIANPKTGYIISEDAKDKILEMKKEELKQLIFKAESIYNQYSISFFDLM
ncbi:MULTISPECIES: GntR family transcriptional regulator [Staphylococcus]|mgnify:CR=1 FL=1|nr:GntR family transcriptional regulator [Staphylococcus capitis]MCC9117488.1 GntR family transcriptional regulator [Staphylococcus capitis]MCC9143949.1 GntR family transcriptional regulator [Staphylococcus capitis]MCM3499982.1 GntR family transcriptional regulator [Staphylococcus capitis]HBG3848844.1 GntR family transcriptional regulator [Clostridioides difficile]